MFVISVFWKTLVCALKHSVKATHAPDMTIESAWQARWVHTRSLQKKGDSLSRAFWNFLSLSVHFLQYLLGNFYSYFDPRTHFFFQKLYCFQRNWQFIISLPYCAEGISPHFRKTSSISWVIRFFKLKSQFWKALSLILNFLLEFCLKGNRF